MEARTEPQQLVIERDDCPQGGLHRFAFGSSGPICTKCGAAGLFPQPGPQEMQIRSEADIVIFGGAKGGGKSYGLLLEAIRHRDIPAFGAVIFRRESPQIYNIGGLWDTSEKIFPLVGAQPVKSRGEWIFPKGPRVKFSHLEYDKDIKAWDGQQVPLIGFDELTLFTAKQFWYMLTINRSTCGVKPLIRATCNPDADSWVAELVSWWIDPDTGYPIPERAGVVRYFVRVDGTLVWGDSADELKAKYPGLEPKSLTFIPAKLEDNPTLEFIDRSYRANLMAQDTVEQERLIKGNWKIRPTAGLKFPRDKWVHLSDIPAGPWKALVRFWDKAYTEGGQGAKTAGVLMGELANWQQRGLPRYIVLDCRSDRWGDAKREAEMLATAHVDRAEYQPHHVRIGIEDEGGAGKQASRTSAHNLAGFDVYLEMPKSKKHLRWTPLAAQQQLGHVGIVDGPWAGEFIRELDALAGDETLDKKLLKDKADAAAGAFKGITEAGFGTQSELTCSGGESDNGAPLTTKEINEMPEFLRELVKGYHGLDDLGGD